MLLKRMFVYSMLCFLINVIYFLKEWGPKYAQNKKMKKLLIFSLYNVYAASIGEVLRIEFKYLKKILLYTFFNDSLFLWNKIVQAVLNNNMKLFFISYKHVCVI